jgi:CBS-domain-containing membrane protein
MQPSTHIKGDAMLENYAVIASSLLQAASGFCEPTLTLPERVGLDDSAASVMTDFERVSAVIIRPADALDEAHRRMIQRGVRLLLVVDQNRKVVGLITATDILGEKPLQVIAERGCRREEILVRDIMTPQHRLEVLHMADVRGAKVGHVVATLKKSGRQHAVVVANDARGGHMVRGLFSATQVARQLGVAIQTSEVARTFSEIEALLAH